ncbi:MAG: DUF4340 domain-containing protein [Chloroflexota bacterium]|nr:DUF4340 domain-containing protein [Chloroflexota bacterium]
MNLRITIGFLAAALILSVLVIGLDKFNIGPTSSANANATATTTASQQPQIFQFDDSKVNAFELHQADKSVRVEKQPNGWMVAGTGDPANRVSFTSLITRMSTLKATQAVADPGTDLSQFGLDTPRESAVARLDDGSSFQLDLGSKTPVQTGTYAKKADSADIYVIADQFSTDLERLINDPKEPPTPTPLPATPVPAPAPDTTATPTPGA